MKCYLFFQVSFFIFKQSEFPLSLFHGAVPDQAGGPAASNERPARQSVRAARHGLQRSGTRQQEAHAGQSSVPAEDPQVCWCLLYLSVSFLIYDFHDYFTEAKRKEDKI